MAPRRPRPKHLGIIRHGSNLLPFVARVKAFDLQLPATRWCLADALWCSRCQSTIDSELEACATVREFLHEDFCAYRS